MLPGSLRKQATAVREFATLSGFDFQAFFDRNELGVTSFLHTLDDWTEGRNLVRGKVNGREFQMFDMTKVVSSRNTEGGSTHSEVSQTVFLFENRDDLPTMHCQASTGVFSLMSFAGSMGVAFQSDSGLPEETELISRFNQRYLVDGAGFEANKEPREAPDCWSLEFIRELEGGRGWCVEVCESHVAIVVRRKVLPAEDRQTCLHETDKLLGLLGKGRHGSERILVRQLGQPGLTMVAGKMLWPFLGAAVTMVGTTVVFGAIMMSVDEPPTTLFMLFPIVGLAMMVFGALAGLKLGQRWSKNRR